MGAINEADLTADEIEAVPPSLDFHWKASVYNHATTDDDGTIILYNAFMGALARVPSWEAGTLNSALREGFQGVPKGILSELALNGFFVPGEADELADAGDAQRARSARTDVLELILMPNENCNFRCVYCYESFLRGKMKRDVIEGIIEHVRMRASDLVALRVGWFGGEPLTAPNIIEEVSTRLQEICADYDIEYSSSMVTNGYLLTREVADMLFRAEVRQFQITLDGPRDQHNRLRVLANGTTGTYDRIFANLMMLRESSDAFQAVVRVNFDSGSKSEIDSMLSELQARLEGDPRFNMDFHPVGQWGGPNDENLNTCGIGEGRDFRNHLFEHASERGLNLKALRQRLEPFGSVCYAANPHSFVIGSDGMVYKCTVAFEDPRNHVGRLTRDGQLSLDDEKFRMWTSSGAESDTGCQACFFRPACQGNSCPLERINSGRRPCPTTKTHIDGTLQVLAADAVRKVHLGLPERRPPAPQAVGERPGPRGCGCADHGCGDGDS